MKKRLIYLSFLLALPFSSLFAGIYLEPLVGYTKASGEHFYSGNYTIDEFTGTQTSAVNHKYAAPTYGARIGYRLGNFLLGAEYSKSEGSLKTTGALKTLVTSPVSALIETNYNASDEIQLIDKKLFIGFEISNYVIWAGKLLETELSANDNYDSAKVNDGTQYIYNDVIMTGDGLIAGLGLKIFSNLYLNFEYIKFEFKNVKSIKHDLNYTYGEGERSHQTPIKYKKYLLSISYRLEL